MGAEVVERCVEKRASESARRRLRSGATPREAVSGAGQIWAHESEKGERRRAHARAPGTAREWPEESRVPERGGRIVRVRRRGEQALDERFVNSNQVAVEARILRAICSYIYPSLFTGGLFSGLVIRNLWPYMYAVLQKKKNRHSCLSKRKKKELP